MLTTDQDTWMIVGDPSWTDYTIELAADPKNCWMSRNYSAVGFHIVDLNNMAAFGWAGCESYWYVVENGDWKEVPNTEAKPGGEFPTMKFIVENNQYAAYVNDQKLSSFFNEKFKSGKVALRIDPETLIDNFIIKQVIK